MATTIKVEAMNSMLKPDAKVAKLPMADGAHKAAVKKEKDPATKADQGIRAVAVNNMLRPDVKVAQLLTKTIANTFTV